jgi:hypothetical protein
MGISSGEVSIVDVLERMEQGMDADIARRFRGIAIAHGGADNELDLVTRFSRLFNGSITQARTFLKGIPNMATDTQYNAMLQSQRGMPEAGREIAELKAGIDTMNVRNLIIEAGQGIWDSEIGKAIEEAKKQYQDTTGRLPLGVNLSYLEEGPSLSDRRASGSGNRNALMNEIGSYFGDATQHDRAASQRVRNVLLSPGRRSREESDAASRSFNILANLPEETRHRWDSENKLNPLASSSTAVEILAALRELIEIETRNGDRIEELAGLDVTIRN